MAYRLNWTSEATAIASFDLSKSIDMGETYSSLVNIPFDTTGDNYDRPNKHFFYNDTSGQPGHIYKVVINASTATDPLVIIAPPAPPAKCMIIGYMLDAGGYVPTDVQVSVEAYGTRGERWGRNPTGIVGQNKEALGITARRFFVKPDANGMWSVNLIRKVFALIEIPAINFRWAFEVPDKDGPVNIRDIPQLRGQDLALFPEMDGTRALFPES